MHPFPDFPISLMLIQWEPEFSHLVTTDITFSTCLDNSNISNSDEQEKRPKRKLFQGYNISIETMPL